jgi:hypothetical protein
LSVARFLSSLLSPVQAFSLSSWLLIRFHSTPVQMRKSHSFWVDSGELIVLCVDENAALCLGVCSPGSEPMGWISAPTTSILASLSCAHPAQHKWQACLLPRTQNQAELASILHSIYWFIQFLPSRQSTI